METYCAGAFTGIIQVPMKIISKKETILILGFIISRLK
jgi:hypothetical protein